MIIQPTKAHILSCTIDGFPHREGERNNYHIQELRIYEDHCKPYFTGQLVIEAHQNTWDTYVNAGAIINLSFEAPRSDGGPTKTYTESFRVYSYESKAREGDTTNSMVITISLIGQEYYNDRQNVVLQSFANIPGTAAAAAIHGQYMASHGGLDILSSALGMIGLQTVPHQVTGKKPIKAIHDILDKSVFAAYPSCAPTYFRNKNGYVIAPLQQLLETAPVAQTFTHNAAEGAYMVDTMQGYDKMIALRPMTPPSQASASGSVGGLSSALAFFDLKSGNYLNNFQEIGNVISGLSSDFQNMAKSFQGGIKGKYGGRQLMTMLDSLHQPLSVAKNGPGGFKNAENQFLTTLGFTPKYWVTAPMQTGLNVTCGQRVNLIYPVAGTGLVAKTCYVARLVHELKFTEGRDRRPFTSIGTTELFCVHW